MGDAVPNGYVTKAQVLLWIGSTFGAIIVVVWTLLTTHSARVHEGSLETVRFEQYINEQREWRMDMKKQLDDTNTILLDILKEQRNHR